MRSLHPEERAGVHAIPHVRGSSLPWLTAEQMREIDRIMIEDLGITLVQMMENAGRHLADLVIRRWRPRSALVLVGSGGNGGGGIVAARHLAGRGVDARIVLAGSVVHLGRVPELQLGIAERLGIPVWTEPTPADVVVDSLLGYSLEGDPRGRPAELIAWANEAGSLTCALDLPSGLDATTGRVGEPCVRAAATLTRDAEGGTTGRSGRGRRAVPRGYLGAAIRVRVDRPPGRHTVRSGADRAYHVTRWTGSVSPGRRSASRGGWRTSRTRPVTRFEL